MVTKSGRLAAVFVPLGMLVATAFVGSAAGASAHVFVDSANEGGLEDGTSWATAWGTIAEAVRDGRWQGNPGSVILIRPGTYREQIDLGAPHSGAPGALNVIQGADAGVVIDGEKTRNECFLIDGGAAHIKIDRIVCRNARHRGFLVKQAASNLVFSNNVVFNSSDSGIELSEGASQNAVLQNRIYSSGSHGIAVSAGGPGNVLRNNLIYDNGENGIEVLATAAPTVVQNNTLVANQRGIWIDSPGIVTNNILAGNRRVGLDDLGGADTVNDYNCFHANLEQDYAGANGAGPHSVTADPLFVDPAGADGVLGGAGGDDDDFHLQSLAGSYHGGRWLADPRHSPCIDAGDPRDDYAREPEDNGDRINVGAYGNTPEASRSLSGDGAPGEDRTPPAGRLAINGDAAFTRALAVTLSLIASDPSGVSEMCVSSDATCSAWEAYLTSRPWLLPPGDGTKTVYAWFRDGAGNVTAGPVSDQITLDTVPPSTPTTLASPSHAPEVWSRDRTIAMRWSGAADAGSGVGAYSVRWTTSPLGLPDTKSDTTGTTSTSPSLPDGQQHYVHVRTRDRAGNWSPSAAHAGPFFIDRTRPIDGTLSAAAGDQQVVLSWTGFSDAMSGLAAGNTYTLVVGTARAPAATCTGGARVFLGTETSFTHQNLQGGTTYYYRLCAFDRAGNVSAGATARATPR